MSVPFKKDRKKRRAAASRSLHKSLSSLLARGEYSDLVIKCQSKVFKVHRAIVCSRSAPLAAMLDDQSKALRRELNLDDDEPSSVELMISFLYRDSFDVSAVLGNSDPPLVQSNAHAESSTSNTAEKNVGKVRVVSSLPGEALIRIIKVFILGEKYQIQSLKDYSSQKYREIVSDLAHTAEFVTSIKMIYNNTKKSERALRDVVIRVACANRVTLNVVKAFKTLLLENAEIGLDLFRCIATSILYDGNSTRYEYHCPDCGIPVKCSCCGTQTNFMVPRKYEGLELDDDADFQCCLPACGQESTIYDFYCQLCETRSENWKSGLGVLYEV